MKKLLRHFIISIIIVAIFIGLGYVGYISTGEAFLARVDYGGGEMIGYYGIGFYVVEYHPLSGPGEPSGGGSDFFIDPNSTFVYVILFTGIQLLISLCISRIKKKKNNVPS
jgi:hypothetical protein